MNSAPTTQSVSGKPLQYGWSHWFVVLAEVPPPVSSSFALRVIAGEGRARKLYLGTEVGFAAPSFAERNGCAVIFSGSLCNPEEFQHDVVHGRIGTADDAEIIL